jgi:hypothetical protein
MRSLKAGGPGLAFEAWDIGHPAILCSPKGRSAAGNHKKRAGPRSYATLPRHLLLRWTLAVVVAVGCCDFVSRRTLFVAHRIEAARAGA